MIIQIALGIVLAVLILALLPWLLSVASSLVLIALGIAAVGAVIAATLWIGSEAPLFLLIIAGVVVAFYIAQRPSYKQEGYLIELKKKAAAREALGYDASDLHAEILEVVRAQARQSTAKQISKRPKLPLRVWLSAGSDARARMRESLRRNKLGYLDDEHKPKSDI